jgi:RNA polymerase sigma factor (sigma-70 family)
VEAGEPVPDAELLARFAGAGDEAAFELLVWRHAALVLGVCRRIVRDDHLAEDAFQAVFLVLARKAASVRGANLPGWLFRVARRVAARARRQAERRARREAPLTADVAGPPLPCPAEDRESLAVLDEEVARLPDRFRLPVLLCYLGGRTTEDAARVLGCPRGTVLSRLATARQRLAARLTRRGVALPAGVLGTVAVPSVSGVVPPAVRASLAFVAAGSPLTTSNPILLANGVLTAMKLGKTLSAAAVLVVSAGLFGGYALLGGPGNELVTQRAAADPPKAAEPPKKGEAAPPAEKEDADAARRAEQVKRLTEAERQLGDRIAALSGKVANDRHVFVLRAADAEVEHRVEDLLDEAGRETLKERLRVAARRLHEASNRAVAVAKGSDGQSTGGKEATAKTEDAVHRAVAEVDAAKRELLKLEARMARRQAQARLQREFGGSDDPMLRILDEELQLLLAARRVVRERLIQLQYGLPEPPAGGKGDREDALAVVLRELEALRREVEDLKRK